jgi:hypothetical protein
MPEKRVSIEANVEDEFTEPLSRFSAALEAIDNDIRSTGGGGNDEIHVDVEVDTDSAQRALNDLDDEIGRLDDDVDDEMFSDFNVAEQATAEEFIGPYQFQRERPSASSADTGMGVATEGGEDDATLFSARDIDKLDDLFGEYLDDDALAQAGGEVQDPEEILEVDMEQLIDGDELIRAARDPDSDVDFGMVRDARGRGGLDAMVEAVDALDSMDGNFTQLNESSLRRGFRMMGRNLSELQLSIRALHVAYAALIPLVINFIGAIPAALAGLVAIGTAAIGAAAALGGIAALGLAGISLQQEGELSLAAIQEALTPIADSIATAFAPLAQTFVPTIERGIQSIAGMMGPLASASSLLLEMRENFQAGLDYFTSAVPSFTRELLSFTQAMMPVLSSIGTFLAETDFFGGLADQTTRALPSLVRLGDAVIPLVNAVLNLSQGFLVVASRILWAAQGITVLLGRFDAFGMIVGAVIGLFFALSGLIGLFNVLVTGATGVVLGWAKALLGPFAAGMQAAILQITGYNISMATALALTAALVSVLTFFLAPVIVGLADKFDILGGNIADARKELERFGATAPGMRGVGPTGETTFGNGGNVYRDNSTTVIAAGNPDDAARQQYSREFERQQHVDSVFGN